MSSPFIGWMFLALLGVSLAGLLKTRLRMERERHRADTAESRSRSYLAIIESLAKSLRKGDRASQAWERVAEAARLQGIPEPELALLGERIGPPEGGAGAASPAGSKPVVSDTRYLFVSFEEEISRAAEQGRPLTLLTLEAATPPTAFAADPRVFDRVLRGVAHAVRGQLRGCDTCIRFADREFILILPGVSREEARGVEERIRTAVSSVTIEPRPGTVLGVHPILGSATYPEDGSSFDQLLTLAGVRRSRDLSSDLPGGPSGRGSASLPWPARPLSAN